MEIINNVCIASSTRPTDATTYLFTFIPVLVDPYGLHDCYLVGVYEQKQQIGTEVTAWKMYVISDGVCVKKNVKTRVVVSKVVIKLYTVSPCSSSSDDFVDGHNAHTRPSRSLLGTYGKKLQHSNSQRRESSFYFQCQFGLCTVWKSICAGKH